MSRIKISGDDDDRISNLPVCILHSILFYLPVKEEARTCILSKSWNTLVLSSLPQCSFDCNQLYLSQKDHALYTCNENERGQKFINLVEDSLRRLNAGRFEISTFNIYSRLSRFETVYFFDRWLPLVARHHVKQLCMEIAPHVRGCFREVSYKFPEIAIASTTPLHTLGLVRCLLQRNSLCDNNDIGNFGALPLQRLSLSNVRIDNHDGAFQNFISRCHSLVYLSITDCSGVKNLRLCNNPKVETLVVFMPFRGDEILERIELDSLDLRTVTCMGQYNMPLIVEATRCRNLVQLHIYVAKLEYHFVHDLANHFPLLEDLYLANCTGLGSVRVVRHPSLKLLRLESNDLNELDVIDTPNLVCFKYIESNIPTKLFSSNASSNMNSLEKSRLSFSPKTPPNTLWFVQLKTFLGKFNKHNLTLRVFLRSSTCEFNVDELSGMSSLADLLPYVKTLDLYLTGHHFVSYGRLFDGLFWSCHPKKINVTTNETFTNNAYMKVIHEIIVTGSDEDLGCCNCHSIKCRHRCLKGVSIYLMPTWRKVNTTSTALFEIETLLRTLGTCQHLNFKLSWV